MKLSLISFTLNGGRLCQKLQKELIRIGYDVKAYSIPSYALELNLEPLEKPLKDWAEIQFIESEGIIFIGATGIAVRAIAPFVTDKTKDPGVLVIDEKGTFVIPLLSGHIGGANELGLEIARMLGAVPVITTATDINHKFAVDVFAKKNHLYISSLEYAKEISAAVLNNKKIGFISDFPVVGGLPESLIKVNTGKKDADYEKTLYEQKNLSLGIQISLKESGNWFSKTLQLIPKILTLGIGCRRGKSLENIESLVYKVLKELNLSIYGVKNVATIDLKKEEEGLLEFCKKYNLPLKTYSQKALAQVSDTTIEESEFVKRVTGVGNVCERAAFLGSENGRIIQKKTSEDGVTLSVAIKEWSVTFE